MAIRFTFIFMYAAVMLSTAQDKPQEKCAVIAFWNVENLYDTINDPRKNDEDFLPQGPNVWTGERYRRKIGRLSEVISKMGAEITAAGPSLLGLCEVENGSVLKDLLEAPALKPRNYQYILIEGPDARGVDPAFVYNPMHFRLSHAVSYPVRLVSDSVHRTRDILVVSGYLDGDALCVLVNHWPSRRGGELASRENRNAAARTARRIADSVSRRDPSCQVIIMGDLNDDPVNESVKKHIGTYDRESESGQGRFFNPMESLYRKGTGTLAWQDSWNLFDQIILSDNWLSGDSRWKFRGARVFNKPFLRSDHGNFKGYPFRTYSGGSYTGGYSDHFPSYIFVCKRQQDAK
jgi:hypothetical protein